MVKKKNVEKKRKNVVGRWAFIVGMFLAVLLGLGFTGQYHITMLWAVFLLGIIVGILNIAGEEVASFLRSGTVLVLVSFLGVEVGAFEGVAPAIVNILTGILTLFVPATIIVALRSVFRLAKD